MASCVSIQKLPDDMLKTIFSFLSPRCMIQGVLLSNKLLRRVGMSDMIWKPSFRACVKQLCFTTPGVYKDGDDEETKKNMENEVFQLLSLPTGSYIEQFLAISKSMCSVCSKTAGSKLGRIEAPVCLSMSTDLCMSIYCCHLCREIHHFPCQCPAICYCCDSARYPHEGEMQSCQDCEFLFCVGCRLICSQCDNTFCHRAGCTGVRECSACLMNFCSTCRTFNVCTHCEESYCVACQPASGYLCHHCIVWFCNDCEPFECCSSCGETEKKFCDACQYDCLTRCNDGGCDNTFCSECEGVGLIRQCEFCEDIFCVSCRTFVSCDDCEKTICSECRGMDCENCNQWDCLEGADDFIKNCYSCGDDFCASCRDFLSCSNCHQTICSQCESDLAFCIEFSRVCIWAKENMDTTNLKDGGDEYICSGCTKGF